MKNNQISMLDLLTAENLEKEIREARNSLSADRLDMSFGELMNMYQNDELIIDPDFQRLFRWGIYQRTRFIESLLLGIPIPSIFVAEDTNGKWEIVDGLQRLSTVLSFFGMLKNDGINDGERKNAWTMDEGDIVKELHGLSIENIPTKYQLNIKRSVCRVEVVKWDSKYDMRYELFNRLNTGGSPLTDQEIRNCIFRSISPDFTEKIKVLAANPLFISLIEPTDKQKQELYMDELVLRFFSLFNNHQNITKNLSDHMTAYMKQASKNPDDYIPKIEVFTRTVALVSTIGKPVITGKNSQLSTSLYDAIIVGVGANIDFYEKNIQALLKKIEIIKEDEQFKKASGASSNYKERTKKRVSRALEIFSDYD